MSIEDLIQKQKELKEELIAAAAGYAEAEADGDDDLICNAIRKLQWTKDRRSIALARVGGGQ